MTKSHWQIVPRAGIGVQQVLTDGEYDISMAWGSDKASVTRDDDDAVLTVDLGIELKKNNYAFGFGYTGSYSDDVSNSSFFLEGKLFF